MRVKAITKGPDFLSECLGRLGDSGLDKVLKDALISGWLLINDHASGGSGGSIKMGGGQLLNLKVESGLGISCFESSPWSMENL